MIIYTIIDGQLKVISNNSDCNTSGFTYSCPECNSFKTMYSCLISQLRNSPTWECTECAELFEIEF